MTGQWRESACQLQTVGKGKTSDVCISRFQRLTYINLQYLANLHIYQVPTYSYITTGLQLSNFTFLNISKIQQVVNPPYIDNQRKMKGGEENKTLLRQFAWPSFPKYLSGVFQIKFTKLMDAMSTVYRFYILAYFV